MLSRAGRGAFGLLRQHAMMQEVQGAVAGASVSASRSGMGGVRGMGASADTERTFADERRKWKESMHDLRKRLIDEVAQEERDKLKAQTVDTAALQAAKEDRMAKKAQKKADTRERTLALSKENQEKKLLGFAQSIASHEGRQVWLEERRVRKEDILRERSKTWIREEELESRILEAMSEPQQL